MKGGPSLLVCWACRASERDFCSALVAPVGPVQNIFFSWAVSRDGSPVSEYVSLVLIRQEYLY
jgi:hypothetical protein